MELRIGQVADISVTTEGHIDEIRFFTFGARIWRAQRRDAPTSVRDAPRDSEATPIGLTRAERAELEGSAGSRKRAHRLRQRVQIVLHAADGMSTRAIGRAVGCTTRTAWKWRVRY